MSPLIKTLMRFAKTRKGRELMGQATKYAQSPQGRKQIAQVQRQLDQRRKKR
jgi:hypothetical protein